MDENTPNPSFPDIGVEEPVDEEIVELTPDQAKIAELEKKIAEQNEKFQKQNDDFLKVLSTRPQQTVPQQPVQVHQPAPEPEMPDVLEDPQGYAKFVQEQAMRNAQNFVTQETTQLKNKYEEDKKYEQVFNKFKQIDPKIAQENAELVEFIAVKRVKEAASQGLDVNSYIFGNPDQFAAQVMNDVRAQLGVVKDDDNDRTGGLATTANVQQNPVKKTEEKVKTFEDSMKELRYRGY